MHVFARARVCVFVCVCGRPTCDALLIPLCTLEIANNILFLPCRYCEMGSPDMIPFNLLCVCECVNLIFAKALWLFSVTGVSRLKEICVSGGGWGDGGLGVSSLVFLAVLLPTLSWALFA